MTGTGTGTGSLLLPGSITITGTGLYQVSRSQFRSWNPILYLSGSQTQVTIHVATRICSYSSYSTSISQLLCTVLYLATVEIADRTLLPTTRVAE
jgi:hypothetical protein